MRETIKRQRGYSLDDTVEFLEYDRKSIEYWLRMGHLSGEWDNRESCWKVSPQSIIEFLRQSREPMPTGSVSRKQRQHALAGVAAGEVLAD